MKHIIQSKHITSVESVVLPPELLDNSKDLLVVLNELPNKDLLPSNNHSHSLLKHLSVEIKSNLMSFHSQQTYVVSQAFSLSHLNQFAQNFGNMTHSMELIQYLVGYILDKLSLVIVFKA